MSSASTTPTDRLKGYRGLSRAVLERFGVGVWSEVELESSRGHFRGLILPRSETADDKHLVLKLASGYNVGIAAESISALKEVGRALDRRLFQHRDQLGQEDDHRQDG